MILLSILLAIATFIIGIIVGMFFTLASLEKKEKLKEKEK